MSKRTFRRHLATSEPVYVSVPVVWIVRYGDYQEVLDAFFAKGTGSTEAFQRWGMDNQQKQAVRRGKGARIEPDLRAVLRRSFPKHWKRSIIPAV